jgi:hypothetical protein
VTFNDVDHLRANFPRFPARPSLLCHGAAVSIEFSRADIKPRLGIDPIEIRGTHSPFLARPRELAALHDELARA